MEDRIESFVTEQNVISIILQNPEKIYDLANEINKDFFTNDPNRKQNRCLFMVANYLASKRDVDNLELDPMTIISVTDEFPEVKKSLKRIFKNQQELIQYIEMLEDMPVDASNLDVHVEKLKKVNLTNDLLMTLDSYQDNLIANYEKWETEEIVNRAESEILKISNKYNAGSSEESLERKQSIVERYKNKKPSENDYVGLPIPFKAINDFTRGLLRPGSATVINAPTNVGKSVILKNVAKYLAIDKGIPVYLGANEQSPQEQEERLIMEITGLPSIIIENGLYNADREEIKINGRKYKTKECKEKVLEAVERLQDAPLYIDQVTGYTPTMLVQRAKYFKKRHNIKAFIWDYVKMSSASEAAEEQLRIFLGSVVQTMKEEIAENLRIPVLTASQAKTYEYHMSAESHDIERFSTAFCILRELDEDEKTRNPRADYGFTVKKNRFGPKHKDWDSNFIPMQLNTKRLKFEEEV